MSCIKHCVFSVIQDFVILLSMTSVSQHIALQFIRDPALHWAASLTNWKDASNWIRQESVLGLILFNIFIKDLKDGIRIDAY